MTLFSSLSLPELVTLSVALAAILTVGSASLRTNVRLFALQTLLMSIATALYGLHRGQPHLYLLAAALFVFKTVGVPCFLDFAIKRVGASYDRGNAISAPLAMHVSTAVLAISFLLARQLPVPAGDGSGWPGATAAISIVCTGLVMMLTRRIALSQIIGFLVLENGIYLFGLTQTKGMPMLVEMGVLLDVLTGVMIAGLLVFRIKKTFEHIDVTMLSELRD
jgi:hydrogenase-4 component E